MSLESSWNAFNETAAKKYLDPSWHPNSQSLPTLIEVINALRYKNISILELGCGNASNLPVLRRGLSPADVEYHGIDFSEPLLNAALASIDRTRDSLDYQNISNLSAPILRRDCQKFDLCLISHVIEIVESPSQLLSLAKQSANKVIIRWFRPPTQDLTRCELLQMNREQTGNLEPVPFIRWSINHDDYVAWSQKAGFRQIEAHNTIITDRIDLLY